MTTVVFFFFNNPPTTEISPLPLHDALPIFVSSHCRPSLRCPCMYQNRPSAPLNRSPISASPCSTVHWSASRTLACSRSEEHTSELQSRQYLVCRLLLEKKKKK